MIRSMRSESPTRTISVGGILADIAGFSSDAIQTAADALKATGGGLIALSAGTFILTGPVRLYSNIHLKGQGPATVLKKADGFISGFADDVDYGVDYAVVADSGGFAAGMGILIKDTLNRSGWGTSTSKIIRVIGNTIYFDRLTLMDYSMKNDGTVSTASSMIEAVKVENVTVSDMALDGNKENNFSMDSCRGGAVYFHKAMSCTLANAEIRDYNGDGVSWQITRGITLDAVEVSGCTGIGMHPGTGSANTIVRNCSSRHNGVDGLFVCWRVQNSVFSNNEFSGNAESGISIGHKDSGNLFEGNRIRSNGRAGIVVRGEESHNSADNNTYRGNIIEDNGVGRSGCGILFEAATKGNTIQGNTIRGNTIPGNTVRNADGCGQIAGIVSPGGFEGISISGNVMSGHAGGDLATHLK